MKIYKCATKSLSLETSISYLQFHTKPRLEYLLKLRLLSLKPVFLILLKIRDRPFAVQILSFNAMAAGGEGLLKKFLHGGVPPRGRTLTLLYTIFSRKTHPFRIPSIDKWYPFHILCSELCAPFNCCKCIVI